ncbi:apolipoprotein N-acyltransferase [Candidatus Atelocyanobacterium thalassae]|uniref:Apolipoprotein N-acyltransferase n=1 Tax=Atelocyanobacterium thalassa (isolate ALOHA) TaxID=1453429 RepID=D3EPR6_ATETH|nr:apolipoprotein N-acyltransferase [Candidatus Atelocyanobacterium thalassa]ADB95466.1 apolipoprotein N-acyltransferase [Candidatus Atelocyanobacterium thalassa isolate ALOHA]MCH2543605.1 apolipoprotein N-acyltransferase [Candidatus Atelocyanobacterium sp. ALOHA_A2.5_9]|tara:strand:- start:40 stop:1704 length:1665 start_codon:yes stop_codon:yes gene_type:complete
MRILLVGFGGLLMGLSTAPFSNFYFAWIALVPLWVFLVSETTKHITHKKFKNKKNKLKLRRKINEKTLIAIVWGFSYHGFSLFWVTSLHPMTWIGISWISSFIITTFCWLFVTCWGIVLVLIWSFLMCCFTVNQTKEINYKKITSKCIESNTFLASSLFQSLKRIIFGIAIWCILEMIWSQSPLWWTSLSYTQSPSNLAILQLTKLSGYSTVTALIVAINGLISESILIINKNRKQFFLLNFLSIITILFSHLYGLFLYNHRALDSNDKKIKIGMIQGNIPNTIKLSPEGKVRALKNYSYGYEVLAKQKVDLIITPEVALPFNIQYVLDNSALSQKIMKYKVPIILGALGDQKNGYTNSLFTITDTGKILSRFDKVKLVPLGEYIPLENIFGKLINYLSPLENHLITGKNKQVFDTSVSQAIVGICYESAFSEHFRYQASLGGEYIVTASNNAHFTRIMPSQHHSQDVIRAIETDRWMAKVTNTGYSAIINPNGDTLWISKMNMYEIHKGIIYARNTQTLYVRMGNWLIIILSCMATMPLLKIFLLLIEYTIDF